MSQSKFIPNGSSIEALRLERDSNNSNDLKKSTPNSSNKQLDLLDKDFQGRPKPITITTDRLLVNSREIEDQDGLGGIPSSPSSESSSNSPPSVADRRLNNKRLPSLVVLPNRVDKRAQEEARKSILNSLNRDKQVLNRNKRMFGMLMGTLEQFKSEETDRVRSTVKRTKVEEKLQLAEQSELASAGASKIDGVSNREESPRDIMDVDKDDNQETKQSTSKTANLKSDLTEEFRNFENCHKPLCNFIKTESKPKLFWLPKEHTPVTERKLKETRDYYNLCIAERTAKFKKDLDNLNERGEEI